MTWSSDINSMLEYQRNILMGFVLVLFGIIIFLIFSLSSTYQNKKFQPFVIEVTDSGMTRVLEPVYNNKVNVQDNIDKYFIEKFIDAVETNNFNSEEEKKRFIGSLTDSRIYNQVIQSSNNRYSIVSVNSWVKMKEQEYLVRFTLSNGGAGESKIAIVGYGYDEQDVDDQSLRINPVGFVIKYYKVENDK